MSLTMYGAQSRRNPPPYEHRTTARQTASYNSMGSTSSTSGRGSRTTTTTTTYGSSYGASSRINQHRKLPNGPGPLPDKFQLDRSNENIRFTSSQSKSSTNKYSSSVGTYLRTPSHERKTSSDSGYGSSSSVKNRFTTYSPLEGRRTKSTSNLTTMKDLSLKDSSTKYSTSSLVKVPGYARPDHSSTFKTKTLENITQLDENENIYLPSSSYLNSDTSLIRHGLTNNSLVSNYSNSSTLSRRGRVSDYSGEHRKEIITADSESLRRSSKGSTSSSSPSTVSPLFLY